MIPNSYRVPGSRLVAGEYPGALEPRLARAKIGTLLDAGISVFIDLTSPDDRMLPYDDILAQEASRRGIVTRRISCPIPDQGVEHPDVLNHILDLIDRYTAEGRAVYVHCWGGVGRTGLVVGCHLVRHGKPGEVALESVRTLFATMSPEKVSSHRGISPQTPEQCEMVRGWKANDRPASRRAPVTPH